MTYEEEQESAIRALREQEEQDALESEMVKAQYIESFSGHELLYSKKVQGLVKALESIQISDECAQYVAKKALEKFGGGE